LAQNAEYLFDWGSYPDFLFLISKRHPHWRRNAQYALQPTQLLFGANPSSFWPGVDYQSTIGCSGSTQEHAIEKMENHSGFSRKRGN
jgi:hypothetical protein